MYSTDMVLTCICSVDSSFCKFLKFEGNSNLAKDGLKSDTTPSSSPERIGEGFWFQLHNSGSNRQDDEEIPGHVANV